MSLLEGNVEELSVHAIIGFDGAIIGGLRVHPDGKHVLFPIGNKITILHWTNKKQYFLSGHTNIISAIDVSKSGKYVASGQINHIGFKAWVIIWDFHKRAMLAKHEIHKVRIETVKFSTDDRYVTSLGGRDCGNIVVWDIEGNAPLSGTEASSGSKGEATALCVCHKRGACFITGGDCNLTIWGIDVQARAINGVDVSTSKIKRMIYCIDVNIRDELCYCGTSTGDNGKILIGAGNGIIDMVEESKSKKHFKTVDVGIFKPPSHPLLKVLKTTNLKSSITSIQIFREKTILAGTENCEIFSIDLESFEPKLVVTCHSSTIYCVAFPYKFSEVFATAGQNDVRIWTRDTCEELLRIKLQNFSCSSMDFAHDGKSLITAWNDGVIRAFTPLSGRLIYAILNAHNKGASALAITHSGQFLVSGGCEGQVRIWELALEKQILKAKLCAHNGPISEIHINNADNEAVTASTDGSCVVWDINRFTRKQVLFANTLFMCVRYYPTGVQILTGGADRKLGYWEVFDGNLVREVEGSPSGAINSLDISSDGVLFTTGGNDQIVKLWKYQEGITSHIGLGHSAVITSVRFSPDQKVIVSTSASGSIFLWKNPFYEPPSENDKKKKTSNGSKKKDESIEDFVSARKQSCPCP
ncbi:hypothetical protein FQR65_LT07692 [Abscondita terminalis]|nr:hypothetical protein FQR65_LT07692 [Abscondita terminalis]